MTFWFTMSCSIVMGLYVIHSRVITTIRAEDQK